jgi:hypothetical protein
VLRRVARTIARTIVAIIVVVLILIGIGLTIIETGWAKNRIRELLVRQANEYLTATLTIDRLEGSIVRGLRLGGIRLAQNGRTLVDIDEISLSYSMRELLQSGTVIRRIRLTKPQFFLARQADGRWDIAAIVKRERREGRQTGPGRPIEIQAIEITDGRVLLNDPLDFGAAHAPTDFESLNASFAFAYFPVRWRLDFASISWIGRKPDLSMTRLTGALGNGPSGWFFDKLSIETPRSAFTLNGRVIRTESPTELDLAVAAKRFAFQEWSGVLRGLRNIAVDASFDTVLKGPLNRLGTDIRLDGSGGSVAGHLTLDTSVPGWRGAGTVNVGRLNLARWLNNDERPSDITGRVAFDLALELGRHFPRGVYRFDGPHAMFMNYAADDVKAQGQITERETLIASAAGRAYGAGVTVTDGAIGIDSPFPYRFRGRVTRIDLRAVPAAVPVPHVDSVLTFDYDVNGRFSRPYITGSALFAPSTFLGASIAAGTFGTIDTAEPPLRYSGDGDLANVNLHAFGAGLKVAWLQNPRYAGTIAGRFQVEGRGTDTDTMTLNARGRIRRGDFFNGRLSDGDVTLSIERGTLTGSYSGELTGIDPAVAFDDKRWEASLSGSGTMAVTARDLLTRNVTLDDYDIDGSLALGPSTIRGLKVDSLAVAATLRRSLLTISNVEAAGAMIDGHGAGTIPLDDAQSSAFAYEITKANLRELRPLTGVEASGLISTRGKLTGPWSALQFSGDSSVAELDASDVTALTINGRYDVTVPWDETARATARAEGTASFLTVAGQNIQEASGTVAMNADRLSLDLRVLQAPGRTGTINGAMTMRLNEHAVDLTELTIGLGRAAWRLERAGAALATVRWDDHAVTFTPMAFLGPTAGERISIGGDWRTDGNGSLHVVATRVFIDALQPGDRPASYGGVLDADATIRGTRVRPIVTGTVTIANGRVERINYQRLAGRVDFANRQFTLDLRLDQAPGVWVTAVGTVPLALTDRTLPDQPIDVAVKSSGVSLGLVQGVTSVVRNVSGQLLVDVHVVGTARDPHFTGAMGIDGGSFDVTATGAKYKNLRVGLTLTSDRVAIDVFHIEDSGGRPLDLRGSLGTHELRVGELEIEVSARRFEVLRNEFGRLDIESRLQLRGRFEAPLLTGEMTISGGDLRVDEILQRALFQPYAIEPAPLTQVDAVAALNPWERLGMNLTLHVPNTLRLTGDNVQVSPGTPIGLGDINLRVAGDLYLYKDPGQPMYVSGSFDTVSGTYAFQGRRFDVDPASSIVFRGDLNPELYLGVTRDISGVQVRVGLIGPMRQPELRLSSVPPLDESDILSLVVFNTTSNQLTAFQQQELVVRAGALAAGFLATPIVSAISNEIGLDVLEIEPPGGVFETGPKLTVGQEIAPGLVARFSRQFGSEPYDEATVEYYLSRILRLRATFSDAQTLTARSPFRRIERAGIDLLFFFSF